eukprot:TRINITY_DN5510_c0_g1_i4.p1 TRINITY_DN5510_c0_g1~~TRINITY_DN5510_c0_g1_i4.p1  ORF type:complete len:540 (+),score=65.27 TRINITY_DN5510_c0_g1_i4:64-1683(+)
MMTAILACVVLGSLPEGFFVIDPSEYAANLRNDYDWGIQNLPFIDIPEGVGYDDTITAYYYRWRSYRTHINLTPENFYVVTEFGPPVPWAGKYNTIPAAAGHHILEGRWIHNQQYIDDYIRFWFLWGGDPRKYTSWITHSAYERYKVTGNSSVFSNLTVSLSENVLGWEREHFGSYGGRNCFWQNDGADAMEVSISGSGCRPTINSVVAKEAEATMKIAELMNATGTIPVSNLTKIRDNAVNAVLNQQWNPSIKSFAVMPMGSPQGTYQPSNAVCPGNGTSSWPMNQTVSVRELLGFVPFYFSIPEYTSSRNSDYKTMWRQLFDDNGFNSLYGPRTAELRHPCYNYSWSHRDCWNGPTWPYETARLLTAAAIMIRDYPAVEALTVDEYNSLVKQYSTLHTATYAINDTAHPIGSGHVFELVHPDLGYWIDRQGLYYYNSTIKDVGDDYNHSTFTDIIISGLFGLVPMISGLVVDPLLPDWLSYFALDHVLYKGKIVSIFFDKTGDRYNKGSGFTVMVNGQVVSHTATVQKVVIPGNVFN